VASAAVGFSNAERTAALVASAPDPDLPVPRSEWTVADVAAHLVIGLRGYADAALGHGARWRPFVAEGATFPDRLRTFNQRTLAAAERLDTAAASAAIVEAVRLFLETTADRQPGFSVATPWYGDGASVSLAAATALLLGEQLVHGRDLSGALRQPWCISRSEASLVFEAARAMMPLTVNPARAAGLTAVFEFRVGDLRLGVLASTPAHLLPEVSLRVDPYRVTNVRGRNT